MTKKSIEQLVDELTLEEQVSLLSGEDLWSLPAVERLGIAKFRVSDGPNGARGTGDWFGGVTSAAFPVGISIGSSWNTTLAQNIGKALAAETKSKGASVLLAPTVNIHRSVTNGRNFECYSEDPELSAALSVASVKGLQSEGIAATVKHFAGNESEIQRTTMNSEIDERSLREIYLRPFEAAVKEGETWAIMTSYNKLNECYTSENSWLLDDVLRGDWGFDGAVMSDWFGSHTTAPTLNAGLDLEMPGPTRDRGEKLIAAVEAGEVKPETVRERTLNILRLMERTGALHDQAAFIEECAEDRQEHRALIRQAGAEGTVLLKNEGLLPLDDTVGKIAVIGPNARHARIMGGGSSQLNAHYMVSPLDALLERYGSDTVQFSPGCTNHRWEPVYDGEVEVAYFDNPSFDGEPVHNSTLRQSQTFWVAPIAQGKVDQKSFSARIRWNYTPEASGIHSFGLHCAGYSRLFVDGECVVNAHDDWSLGRTFFEEGCDEIVGEKELDAGQTYEVSIEFVSKEGDMMDLSAFRAGIGRPLGDSDIAQAVELAQQSDTALLFVGRSGEWDTEGSDLTDIELPGRQNELIEAVLEVNPRTVVVLQTGGPVEMPWLDKASAVLQAWYPGQECGNAISDVLSGDVEPGGRLPQTFPASWRDNPTWSQDPQVYPGLEGTVRYEEGLFIGYRHYQQQGIAPLFPFGFGLGYTTFELKDMQVRVEGAKTLVEVTLSNTGQRSGSTVVQVYVTDEECSVTRPRMELKAFDKVQLAAGESQQLTLRLPLRAFAFYDVADALWRIEAGVFVISAGFSVSNIRCSQTIEQQNATLDKAV